MALSDRLKNQFDHSATATLATFATHQTAGNRKVATVAKVAVATVDNRDTQGGVPLLCRECPRFEVLIFAGETVSGCQYLAGGEFTYGWRRLPADSRSCIWGNPSTRWRDPARSAEIDKEETR